MGGEPTGPAEKARAVLDENEAQRATQPSLIGSYRRGGQAASYAAVVTGRTQATGRSWARYGAQPVRSPAGQERSVSAYAPLSAVLSAMSRFTPGRP
ncbi:hypothetical protein [Streptomyces sp. NPDC054863]